MATSTEPDEMPPSPLISRLRESQTLHGEPDIVIRYCGFDFPAHIAVFRAKPSRFNEDVLDSLDSPATYPKRLSKGQCPSNIIALWETNQIALESMFQFMYERRYDLHRGNNTLRSLENVKTFCKQQDDVYDVAQDYGIHDLSDLALKHLREYLDTALFGIDAIKMTAGIIGIVRKAVEVIYKDTVSPGNFDGYLYTSINLWPNRGVVCEAATKLLAMSGDMVDLEKGKTMEVAVRKGLLVICSGYAIFGQELMMFMLESEVSITLEGDFGQA
jgi:hypothetical protein